MSLSGLLTSLLAATLLGDAITRALPIDWLSFRPWEAARQYSDWEAAFEPNRHIDCVRCYGDLANMGNIPQYRVLRHERFTTDSWGFRNPREAMQDGAMRVLLIGDSFAGGAGMSDSEMLSRQLAGRLRAGVYNTAPMPLGPDGIGALVRRFGMANGVVLFQHLGWTLTPAVESIHGIPHRQGDVTAHDRFIWSFRRDLFPLRILANQLVKRLQNDRVLQNPYAASVTVEYLANGDPMLFLTEHVRGTSTLIPPLAPWAIERIRETVKYYSLMRDRIGTLGLQFAVLLVPHKITVYRSFLRSTPSSDVSVDHYLPELARALRSAGVKTIDVNETLYEAARASLQAREYVFWPDDTHWSPYGVRIVAAQIQEELDRKPGQP